MSEIVIRPAEAHDAESIRQIYAQPEVYHDVLQLPHPTLEMWQERLIPTPGRRHFLACIDNAVAGNLTMLVEQNPRRSHVATFGIGVLPSFRRCGVASALMAAMTDLCDNWLRITRIELTVYTDNPAALALYRKFGFEVEGTGKQYALRDGEYVDAYFMARMK